MKQILKEYISRCFKEMYSFSISFIKLYNICTHAKIKQT